jgi:uncharacterized protein (DUF2461 family)
VAKEIEPGRGYEHMTDEEVAADMKRRFGTVREAKPIEDVKRDEKPQR